MKSFIKKILKKIGRQFIEYDRLAELTAQRMSECRIGQISTIDRQMQILLHQSYIRMLENKKSLPKFSDIQFRSYSQNGEDGILLYIFALIGTKNKTAVEVCAGNGIECNTANLIIHHGWNGLLCDGDPQNVKEGKRFFEKVCKDTVLSPPKFAQAWITSENINELIKSNGFEGEIDLLSIDVDGVDYWLWKSISCIQPRVVVIEYNHIWPEGEAVTVPNDAMFKAKFSGYFSDYAGASLRALVELGKQQGYRLVGAEKFNFNAFFIKDGIAEDLLPEVSIGECLSAEVVRATSEQRRERVKSYPWVNLSLG